MSSSCRSHTHERLRSKPEWHPPKTFKKNLKTHCKVITFTTIFLSSSQKDDGCWKNENKVFWEENRNVCKCPNMVKKNMVSGKTAFNVWTVVSVRIFTWFQWSNSLQGRNWKHWSHGTHGVQGKPSDWTNSNNWKMKLFSPFYRQNPILPGKN